jgi:hypothetical protein
MGSDDMRHEVFLVEVVFKVHRKMITEGAVEPLPVVKRFYPFIDSRSGFGPRCELAAIRQLSRATFASQ